MPATSSRVTQKASYSPFEVSSLHRRHSKPERPSNLVNPSIGARISNQSTMEVSTQFSLLDLSPESANSSADELTLTRKRHHVRSTWQKPSSSLPKPEINLASFATYVILATIKSMEPTLPVSSIAIRNDIAKAITLTKLSNFEVLVAVNWLFPKYLVATTTTSCELWKVIGTILEHAGKPSNVENRLNLLCSTLFMMANKITSDSPYSAKSFAHLFGDIPVQTLVLTERYFLGRLGWSVRLTSETTLEIVNATKQWLKKIGGEVH